jgi:hypothetical protein
MGLYHRLPSRLVLEVGEAWIPELPHEPASLPTQTEPHKVTSECQWVLKST